MLTTLMDELAPVEISRDSAVPLHRQLFLQLRERILAGALPLGTRLPASRRFAEQLGVSRNTVITAIEQLTAEGLVAARVGASTVVTGHVAIAYGATSNVSVASARTRQSLAAPKIKSTAESSRSTDPEVVVEGLIERSADDAAAVGHTMAISARGLRLGRAHRALPQAVATMQFQPGIPDIGKFPAALWGRMVSRAYRRLGDDLSGYAHAGGYMPLRAALAGYLSASRGVRCGPAQVLVVTSAQAALDLATRMLSDAGDRAWLEQPGYNGACAAFEANGLDLGRVPVDADGVRANEVAEQFADARIGYCTPSHQFPTGATLTMERRLELLAWATDNRAWLLEDDYDSEFRYANRPVAAMQGLVADARVIYIGSFSKTLYPGLRVAYLVVPTVLAASFIQAMRQTGQEPSLPLQAALFDFIEGGHFGRHLRRMRNIYRTRHATMTTALNTTLPHLGQVLEADGGLQLSFGMHREYDDRKFSAAAQQAGFGVEPLSRYCADDSPERGLVFGFGQCPDIGLDERIDVLARALARVE